MAVDRTAPLSQVGEFALIEAITADLPAADEVVIGPGDDAAQIRVDGSVLTSLDVLVEGVHFRRDWSEPSDVGHKAVSVNVADIEAMGGRANAIVVGFSAPEDLPVAWVLDFAAGLRDECAAAGVSLVGGDITRARDVTIAVTVLGVAPPSGPVRRSGARVGDVVAIRGRLGWAAAGLATLRRGFRSPRAAVDAHRRPQVHYGAGGVAAAAGATAMIDVSDGLLADLGHIARASGVGIDVASASIEIGEPLRVVAVATRTDPSVLVLTGGEDHALAATFPAGTPLPPDWQQIGVVTEQGDCPVLVDGAVWEAPVGYDHFRTRR